MVNKIKKIFIGIMFSFMTIYLFFVSALSFIEFLNGQVFKLVTAMICFCFGCLFAWMIGDMERYYGEDEKK